MFKLRTLESFGILGKRKINYAEGFHWYSNQERMPLKRTQFIPHAKISHLS